MLNKKNFTSEGIAFTQFNASTPLNKNFDKDGNKTSNANMYSGTFQTKSAKNVTELFEIFDALLPNQAIGLGVSDKVAGGITTRAKATDSVISRTKDNFHFGNTAYLLADIDPSEFGIEVKSPKHLVQLLRETDPLLVDVEIGVRSGSSKGIYKDGVLISDKDSMHAYFAIENANDDSVKQYKEYLITRAWLLGYGHIELSSVGSIMQRQFFDGAVFSGERLIFESLPTLADNITRVVPEPYIAEGSSYRDLNNISTPPIEAEQIILEAKAKVKGKALELKSKYIDTEVQKRVLQGANESDAKRVVNSRVNDKVLLPDDTLLTNDNIQIKVSDIIKDPAKFDKMYIHDPLETEKGASKAMINAKDANSITIYSFVHGGSTYSVKPDFNYVVDVVDNSNNNGAKENRTIIEKVESLCTQANLEDSERKEIAKILKQKKITTSVFALQSDKEDNTVINYPDKVKGNPLMTMGNLSALMDYFEVQVSYDVILKKTNMSFPFQMAITDDMINTQIAHIKNLCVQNRLSISTEKHYLGAIVDQNSVNPLLNMLNTKWDGVDRITQVLNTLTSPDKTLYKNRVFIKWLIQCVAAWNGLVNCPLENAKIRFENVLVFVADQGVKKTQFFEDLLPREFRDYVATGIHLDPSDKDSIMLAISAGITELGELDSTFTKDIARLKAFLSLKVDKFRRPYDRVEREFQRRTSFCASVNDDEFLVDPTGNRRFIPLKIDSIDFDTYLTIDKVQLWSQVSEQFYLQGYHWWIDKQNDPELVEILNKKHIEHFAMSSADEIAAVVIEQTKNANEELKFLRTATEIAIAFKLPVNGRKNFNTIKKALLNADIPFNSKTKQFKVMYHT